MSFIAKNNLISEINILKRYINRLENSLNSYDSIISIKNSIQNLEPLHKKTNRKYYNNIQISYNKIKFFSNNNIYEFSRKNNSIACIDSFSNYKIIVSNDYQFYIYHNGFTIKSYYNFLRDELYSSTFIFIDKHIESITVDTRHVYINSDYHLKTYHRCGYIVKNWYLGYNTNVIWPHYGKIHCLNREKNV